MFLPDFIIIPYQLITNKRIKPIDEKIYGIIYWFVKLKDGKCVAKNRTIAEICKTTPQVVANSLTILEKEKYIKRTFFDRNKKLRKEIIPLIAPNLKGVSSIDDTVSSVGYTRVSSIDEQNKNSVNKNNNIPITNNQTIIQELIGSLEVKRKVKFVSWGRQASAISKMLKAGYTKKDIENSIERMEKDPYWKDKNPDFSILASQIHRYKQNISLKDKIYYGK